jgi:precorrin-6B methylase 2
MIRIIFFILERTILKFDFQKLKKFNDLGFIFVEKILVKFSKLHPLYFEFYNEIIDNEIKLANISKEDRILHIGSGPIPATSIQIAERTGAKITGIDNNPKAIKQGKACISKLNLDENIILKHANGSVAQIDNYNLIIISQGIKPHKDILEHISSSIKPNVKVIFRTNYIENGKLSNNDLFIKNIFKIVDIVPHKKHGLLISILLTKK